MKTRFLASVTTVDEALLAVAGGADIIDCKDPGQGALGALPVATVAAIRAAVPRRIPVSATIGDLAADPTLIAAACQGMAASGCDLIKVGLFPGGDARGTIISLGRLALPRVGIVGLLLADRDPDFALIDAMADAGFVGVMLDTAGKGDGALTAHLTQAALAAFVARSASAGLFSGLAGSLRVSDVAPLLRLKPNVLGFRGALCLDHKRMGCLSLEAVRRVRAEIDAEAAVLV
jgi:uncharacterized protein (UPF0264 family)